MSRQRLGQHFLIRASVLERIASAACPSRAPLVVEIGPGTGALTAHLLRHADRVVAVELDPHLAEKLAEKYAGETRLSAVEGNALNIDLAQWGPAVFAGNLPYYAATAIIDRVLALGSTVQHAIFLIQREVAARIVARPGSRDYGYLSVVTQFSADAELLFEVPPSAFDPPPKVDSAVLRLIPRDRAAEFGIADAGEFLRFVAVAFHHKRKTLRNNLMARYGAAAGRIPEAALRAEQVPVRGLTAIYRALVTTGSD